MLIADEEAYPNPTAASRNYNNMILYYLLFISLCLQVSTTAVLNGYRSYKNYKVLELEGDENELTKIMSYLKGNHEITWDSIRGSRLQILVAPELQYIVGNMARVAMLSSKVVVDDYSELINKEITRKKLFHGRTFSWTAYYDIEDIYGYLRNVSKNYPKNAQLIVGGRSYEGRDILGLRITSANRDPKPAIIIESGIHAREWIGPATVTYFINKLMNSDDPKIQSLKNNYDWHIFPSVNPDGYHYSYTRDRMWRKTRSKSSAGCYGVDPNRNWDYNWSGFAASTDPCEYQTYAGSKPFSEIETKSLSQYIAGINNLKAYIAFHSDAQVLLLPYSDSTIHDEYYDDLKKIGQVSLDYGYNVNKAKYGGPATAAEIMYKMSGSSIDWVHKTIGTPLAFNFELRGMFFHWPPYRISEQGDEVTQMLLGLVTEAANLSYL